MTVEWMQPPVPSTGLIAYLEWQWEQWVRSNGCEPLREMDDPLDPEIEKKCAAAERRLARYEIADPFFWETLPLYDCWFGC